MVPLKIVGVRFIQNPDKNESRNLGFRHVQLSKRTHKGKSKKKSTTINLLLCRVPAHETGTVHDYAVRDHCLSARMCKFHADVSRKRGHMRLRPLPLP